MFRLDDDWVFSASDLVTALRCEYQLLQKRAEKADLVAPLVVPADALMARAADLGLGHEDTVHQDLIGRYGEGGDGGVVEIAQPSTKSRAELEAAHEATRLAMEKGAQVVFQGAFFDGRFHGLADFLVRTPGADGIVRYEPADTKFARHARVEALLQLASYASQIEAMGLPAPIDVHLWLGDGTTSTHRYADLRPILVDRADRMRHLLELPLAAPLWGDPALRQCGRCPYCKAAAEDRRDLLLVAGMRVDQRRVLAEAGIATVEQLAAATEAPEAMKEQVFAKLHAQAVLQAGQDASRSLEQPDGEVSAELIDPSGIALIPEPNPGDVFFDFEGDPLHLEAGWTDLGLEYLWGTIIHGDDGGPHYDPIWAHDRHQERLALEQFIDWLTARRSTPGFEGLHVYHYAPYEVTALKRLVQRYGTRSDELDTLLKDGVFVDLYGVVRRSVRVSQRSYSIKKLEPLYMGDDLQRDDEGVTGGAESIVWYAEFQTLRDDGDDAAAAAKLEALRAYNDYDCLSTLRLRDWLLALPGGERPTAADAAAPTVTPPAKPNPARELAELLRAPLIDIPRTQRTPQQQAVLMIAAALEYHRREVLPFWWDHFRRVGAPVEDWEHDGEMIVLQQAEITVVADWHRPKTKFERTFRALVDLPGSFKLTPGDRQLFAIHDAPVPGHATHPVGVERGVAKTITFDAIEPVGEQYLVMLTESLPAKVSAIAAEHDPFPAAISADNGLEGTPLAAAILALAATCLRADGTFAEQPAMDLLQRLPPRLISGGGLPAAGDDVAAAIVRTLHDLDRSYLAVQGPPGTGKSTTGARVISALIDEGWKIGVVAQSHRTVEGFLDKVVHEGVDAARVLKKEKGSGSHLGTATDDAGLLACATSGPEAGGCLIGGTTWDFVSNKRVPAGTLDLLVVDEAGQFSLADTIAVSRVAPRLLLLGDPQQLPQVSQALHPEPVDRAALGWLTDGHDTLPPELGYFLACTYRMRPELTTVVSGLAYDGRLEAEAGTRDRTLDGVEPGLHTHLVAHQGNRAASNEEADEVVRLAASLIGRTWTDPHDRDHPGTRPLGPLDVIVVAPFNAQVNRIRERLDRAGLPAVAVGTVDKFQGREAAVVVVSMAASAADSSSRGAGFLLSRHRLNVAISRAQHSAHLIHAPQLTDFVPATPAGLERLGAFLGVSQAGRARG
ncbi:TM0106 family RecB-like putative nuclease [Aquihabitans sp. McL0605]|uniref:TM0106 family RecB-like putative nuclease n=1 Tax=Aquihabitans sp. McL0605 TaxID=3415671 RepID=UPI003CF13083